MDGTEILLLGGAIMHLQISRRTDKQCLYFSIPVSTQCVFCIFMLCHTLICQGSYFDPLLSSNEIPLLLFLIIHILNYILSSKITSSFFNQHINPHLLLYRLRLNQGCNIQSPKGFVTYGRPLRV